MVVVLVLSFVEEGSDEVENAELYVSRDLTRESASSGCELTC